MFNVEYLYVRVNAVWSGVAPGSGKNWRGGGEDGRGDILSCRKGSAKKKCGIHASGRDKSGRNKVSRSSKDLCW